MTQDPQQPMDALVQAADELHRDIMNVPVKVPNHDGLPYDFASAYRMGHRDARHAAAELVAARSLATPADPRDRRYRLVPAEPTGAMMTAFSEAINRWLANDGEDADVYRAMLAAAPPAAEQVQPASLSGVAAPAGASEREKMAHIDLEPPAEFIHNGEHYRRKNNGQSVKLSDGTVWRFLPDTEVTPASSPSAAASGQVQPAVQQAADKLAPALIRLLKNFPTDGDMAEAGWTRAEIEEACNAYDAARALVTGKETN